ncbi:glycoside hydrolase family 16 protein [Gymnopus androsaceus JB14]|uniref:Glycoside hydrolase family 16 protein n=1 Tax=Gymnopus androsaceus JB14 TaxID=1447944 RepID=A0A6A4GQD1_9AGAR|nr:glycoside hydrolase family 16 protein [Gymnopus androsaceus JB14]
MQLAKASCKTFVVLCGLLTLVHAYDLVREYSGITFFDNWDFYGFRDNLTLGNVYWLDEPDAFSQSLAYVNGAGNAVIKVDDTHTVQNPQNRNSVRITTQDWYAVGSLWIIDLVHMPFGCSVWPAFWTLGSGTWPNGGEIDIIEGINQMPSNQYALHSTPGCYHNSTPPNQIGETLTTDCSSAAGCTVGELQPNSYGSGFAAMGGGVFATQFRCYRRPNVPASINQSTSTSAIDISQWGPPSASYLASGQCNITEFFTPQQLVLDITLCGEWAGLPQFYLPACGSQGPTGICYNDSVVGSGSNYDEAYFEVAYIRAYTTGGAVPTPTAAPFEIASKVDVTAYPGYGSISKTATASVGTGLQPSPLFFPGNAARSVRLGSHGCWWVVLIGMGLLVRMV